VSQFTIKKSLVIQVCNKVILEVELTRKELYEKEICRIMSKKRFFLRYPTREKAIKIIDEYDMWKDKPWQYMYWGDLTKANKLIKACSVTEEENVILDTNDANFINNWII
jgi:hypothetical protein